ncbi:MAG: hypothetical protein Q8O41_01505, partial [Candidatus Methanoperedens sp.]|nr:hypothetical protein [Candidatus Methanoperedens sp.]
PFGFDRKHGLKNDLKGKKLCLYALIIRNPTLIINIHFFISFISAAIASLFGIIFSFSVIFGETFTFALSGSSFLKFGFFVYSFFQCCWWCL